MKCENCQAQFTPTYRYSAHRMPRFCSQRCNAESREAKAKARRRAQFWDRVKVGGPDECWPWTGYSPDGRYGRLRFDNVNWPSHRWAYETVHGATPDGLQMRHLCGNTKCCNPAHIRAGTAVENAVDKVAHGTDPKGERNGNAKLTEEAVADIRSAKKHYGWVRKMMAKYDVTEATIHRARRGANWS